MRFSQRFVVCAVLALAPAAMAQKWELGAGVGGSTYLSGPAAKDYMDEGLFKEAGVQLQYMDYSGYPEYPQLYGKFEHGVSVMDLLFNTGPSALEFLLSIR